MMTKPFFSYAFSDNYKIFELFNIMLTAGHFFDGSDRISESSKQEIFQKGIKEFLDTEKEIFMDSGGYQLMEEELGLEQEGIFEIQRKIEPDYAAHLDLPCLKTGGPEKDERLKRTIENAKEFYDLYIEREPNFKPVIVVQGYDGNSFRKCANKYKEIGLDVDYFGIGSLCKLSFKEIRKRVKGVVEVLGKDKKYHLFGVGSIKTIKKLKKDFPITSFDTSSHILAAGFGNVYYKGVQKHMKEEFRRILKVNGNGAKYKVALVNAYHIENELKERRSKGKKVIDSFVSLVSQ